MISATFYTKRMDEPIAIGCWLDSATLPPATIDNRCCRFHLRRDRSSAPKGQPYVSPGQKQCESCEHCCRPGLTGGCRLSPERAARMLVFLVSPRQGFVLVDSRTQGGAPRLRRYALPWANIGLPLRGESEHCLNLFRNNWLQYANRTKWRCPTRIRQKLSGQCLAFYPISP